MRYAQWELEQKEFRRARSVFERALDVDSTAVVLWIRYIEAEMKTRNINHARNLLDRAVTILPRIDKLWYKYVRSLISIYLPMGICADTDHRFTWKKRWAKSLMFDKSSRGG
jgi:tetratricopeptide (TPR) repeat protein